MQTLQSTLRFSGESSVVAVGAASNQSDPVPPRIYEVRVVSTTNAWLNVGDAPVATAGDGSIFLPAGVVEYFHVSPGQQVAAIQDSTGGTLCVGFMTR